MTVRLPPHTPPAPPAEELEAALEELNATTARVLASEKTATKAALPPEANPRAAQLTGTPASSSTQRYDRSTGQGPYAIRAQVMKGEASEAAYVDPDLEPVEVPDLDLEDLGELTEEEREAIKELEKDETPSEAVRRRFLERAAARSTRRSRAQARTEEDRFRFGQREDLVVARRFDDMYRRNEEEAEFELAARRYADEFK